MGLDMYATTVKAAIVGNQQVDISLPDGVEVNHEFAYWRKFNALHGWMERLYRAKGGKGEQFNCDTVRLMPEDIDKLERDIDSQQLEPTAGFFFGSMEIYPEDIASAREFIANARTAFAEGLAVIYHAWW